MKIAILGYGQQGRSAYEYWNKSGNSITICDHDTSLKLPPNVTPRLGEHCLENLHAFDLIVRSPIIHPRAIAEANGQDILEKVTTVTEEFFRVCPAPIIGVTGTKGKGTTSTLITRFLEAAGKRVHLGGNIGIPPLELMQRNITHDDWVVLELANFQLIDLRISPTIGVCVMVAPEHMDWHSDLSEYMGAKQNLFRYQDRDDLAVFNRLSELSADVAYVSPGKKISYEVPPEAIKPDEQTGAYVLHDSVYMNATEVCKVADVALLGRHNLENVCAAVAATWDLIGHRPEVIEAVVKEFKGLEHRLEFVRELNGVKYYDDSFGTTPETAIVAIQAFDEPKVMILGGSDKGAEYGELAFSIKDGHVHTAILIGVTADKIEASLKAVSFTGIVRGGQTMADIVATAQAHAQPGDVVLLSTACASFGMFKDYQDRGDQFKQAVAALSSQNTT